MEGLASQCDTAPAPRQGHSGVGTGERQPRAVDRVWWGMRERKERKRSPSEKEPGSQMLAASLGEDQSQGLSYSLPRNTLDCYLKHGEEDLD